METESQLDRTPHAATPNIPLPDTPRPLPPPGAYRSDIDDTQLNNFDWNSSLRPPLIHGLPNDDLFILLRRFNNQVFHVREIPPPPPGVLDFDVSQDEAFTADKLRINLERIYLTVIVGVATFAKHIALLRSWNEPRRTLLFALAYFFTWHISLLPFLFFITILVLILHPPARRILFPPIPLAAVSATSDSRQVPRASTLASDDSRSGPSEAHPGETVEQEASQFIATFTAVGAGIALSQGGVLAGKHGEDVTDARADNANIGEDAFPDPIQATLRQNDIKDNAHRARQDDAVDAAKKSVEAAVWEKARPLMRILANLADTWERFANALNPTPPFDMWLPRLCLAWIMCPLILLSLTVSTQVVVDTSTFLFGLVFFTQPLLVRGAHRLAHLVPHELLKLRRTFLAGVPTNAQLTITLLRVGEAVSAPLPPPPAPAVPPVDVLSGAEPLLRATAHLREHDFVFDASGNVVERAEAIESDTFTDTDTDTDTDAEQQPWDRASMYSANWEEDQARKAKEGEQQNGEKKKRRGSRFVGLLKRTTRGGVGGVLGIDHLKAMAGSEAAKRRLGTLAPPTIERAGADGQGAGGTSSASSVDVQRELAWEGPATFSGRFRGRRGHLLLVTSAASPCLAFVSTSRLRAALAPAPPPALYNDSDGLEAEFVVGLGDVCALRKLGGLGWKGRTMGRAVLDGLEIAEAGGETRVVTAVKGRDELFNRLVATGGQRWECL